jgi:hypothetical protein
MPAVSKAQQRFMGMVRATQKGEMKNPSPEVQDAANSMKKKDAKDFASTKHKGLPEKVVAKEAVYGGAEAEKKKKIDAFMDKAMPKRTFDQMGRETDRRTGKLKEDMKGYGEERFCELCGKMEYREECSYGPKMWDMFTIRNFSKSVVVPGKATYECKAVNWRNEIAESYLRVQERGRTYTIIFNWRGRTLKVQMFFNKFSRPTREEVRAELNKVYPGPIVLYYNPVKREPTLPLMFAGDSGGDANEPRSRRN